MTYTLFDTAKNATILSCSDRNLIDQFVENRKAHGGDVSRLVVREEKTGDFAKGILNREARRTLDRAMKHIAK
jgi:hypothetical protein